MEAVFLNYNKLANSILVFRKNNLFLRKLFLAKPSIWKDEKKTPTKTGYCINFITHRIKFAYSAFI